MYNKQSIAANQQKIRLTLSDRMGLKKIICSLGCQLSDKKFHFCFLSHCPTIKRFSSINERPLRTAIHTMSCPLREGVENLIKTNKNKNSKGFLRNCHEICKETCHRKDIIKIFCIKSTRFTSSEYFQIQTNA